jgi:hypothetical protein
MIELNPIERIHNEEFDIYIDKYLTPDKVEAIAEEMLKHTKANERTYICNILLAKYCTDIGEDYEYGDYYNDLLCNGVFDAIQNTIVNIAEIYEYIYQAESINVQLDKFLIELTKYLKKNGKKIDNFDMDKAQELLKEMKQK